jgi:hypothetical protein
MWMGMMGMGMGLGMGIGMGIGNRDGNKLLTIFLYYLCMSQILYVPCKGHGDVYIASVTYKKFSLSEPTDDSQSISSAFLSQVLCIIV